MKTAIHIICLLIATITYAQPTLYGGIYGNLNHSTISKYDAGRGTLTATKRLERGGQLAYYVDNGLTKAANEQLYGTTSKGGSNNLGIIFSINPVSGVYKVEHHFGDNTGGGAYPYGSLIQASNGLLYGVTSDRGYYGVIFSFDPLSGTYAVKCSLGAGATGTLIQGADGLLYGMTSENIFSFDPLSNSYTIEHVFNYYNSSGPRGSLMQGLDGLLYGVTSWGGINGSGVIFSFDPVAKSYNVKHNFDDNNGSYGANGSLIQYSDGHLYGTTSSAGSNGSGVIFSFDPVSGSYTVRHDFKSDSGCRPYSSLIKGSDGQLYGMTSGCGNPGYGVIFSFDPATGSYTVKHNFDDINSGAYPYGKLMQATDGLLYGMAWYGGTAGYGVIFSFDLNKNNYVIKKTFSNEDGLGIYGSLMEGLDGLIYGMTSDGGSHNSGVIFSFDPVAGSYTVKHNFDGITGGGPRGSLILCLDGLLYGMTSGGGINGGGVIFSFDPVAGSYTVKHNFDGNYGGRRPFGSLTLGSDSLLYGMTSGGGINGGGVIFSFDPVASSYTVKHNFNYYTNGSSPSGSLTQATDGLLYGMTSQGGSSFSGIIFSLNPATGSFLVKHNFDYYTHGGHPNGSLMLATDSLLYGMTYDGGGGSGVIFSFDPVAGSYTVKHNFDGNSGGGRPLGSLMQGSDELLYGMTAYGGKHGKGVVFSYNTTTASYIPLQDFDGTNGSNPNVGSAFTELKIKAPTRSIKVNVYGGNNPYNNVEWNNWNVSANLNSDLLKYSDATVSSISAVITGSTGIIDNGSTFGIGGMAPAEVLRYTSYTLSSRTLTFSGLLPEARYTLEFYSGRNNSGGKSTIFTVNGHSITVLSDRNKSNKVLFTGLVPDADGKLVVTIKGSDRYNYLNGFILTQNEDPLSVAPVANAGEDKTIVLPPNSITLNGSGSDEDGTVVFYKWTKISGPAVFTINTPDEASTTVSGLIEGTYIFRLTVTDNDGATGTDDVQVLVKGVPPPVPSKYVKVNVYGGVNPFNHPEWTDWNVTGSLSIDALKYSDGTSSSIGAVLSASTGIIDNGSTFGEGMAPAKVLRYTSYTLSARTLTFSGLHPDATYAIEFYSSRNNSGGKSTIFTINGQSITVLSDRNKTNKVVFGNLEADATGKIVVTIKGTDRYNFLNGFILTETGSAPLLVSQQRLKGKMENIAEEELMVSAYPNPATHYFTIVTKGGKASPVDVRVMDVLGRVVEVRQNLAPYTNLRLGHSYKQGVYYVEMIQGEVRQTIKLVKGAPNGVEGYKSF